VTNINSVIAQRLLKNTCIYNNSDISKTFTTTISNDDVLQRDSRLSSLKQDRHGDLCDLVRRSVIPYVYKRMRVVLFYVLFNSRVELALKNLREPV
jgi:hypothetical protein